MFEKLKNKLAHSEIKVRDYSLNQEENYDLDEKTDWIQNILKEVEEEVDLSIEDEKESISPSTLNVSFQLLRKDSDELQDHLAVRGNFKAYFNCHCIRCLKVMKQTVAQDFSYCFLAPHLEKDEAFADATDVYCDGEEMDLHFYDAKGKIDLSQIVYEQIQLEMDPLPLHDEACKGLCGTCGADLNKERCSHSH